jgi:Na+-translocating ferredoxin:NAD+ oxidoreductase RnfG subunit
MESAIDFVLDTTLDDDAMDAKEQEEVEEEDTKHMRVYIHVHSASGLLRNGKARANMGTYCRYEYLSVVDHDGDILSYVYRFTL